MLFTIEVAIGYLLLLYFIALQNINNRGPPNRFPPETQPLLRPWYGCVSSYVSGCLSSYVSGCVTSYVSNYVSSCVSGCVSSYVSG